MKLQRGVPASAVAERLGVNKSTVARWGSGESEPRDGAAEQLRDLYDEVMKAPPSPIAAMPDNERDRAIFRLRANGVTQAEIARIFGISRERVRQVLAGG